MPEPHRSSAIEEPGVRDRGPVTLAELRHVSKAFGAVVAVDDLSLTVRPGEVVGLIGENGAGKSTCVKMLAGVHRPDRGDVLVGGRPVDLHSPLQAHAAGIAVVHQHPTLFPDLSLAENIYAGQYPRIRGGLIDRPAMRQGAVRHLRSVGLRHDPDTLAADLRSSEQQLVEVARALASGCRLLILDEPTAALSVSEVGRLFGVVRGLAEQGTGVLFVGHRLEEILELCARITVMRDGALAGTVDASGVTAPDLVRMMVGRPLTELYPKVPATIGDPVLVAGGLSGGMVQDVDLIIRRGEIVGVAGLVGAGRTELARLIFGIDRIESGSLVLNGKPYRPRSAADALAHGVALVAEDRRGQSLIGDFSILENATLPVVRRSTRGRIVLRRLQLGLITGPLQEMRLRFADYDQPVGTLSGGNQQKVVLAKWLATDPALLLLDEPTQGVDVQAKAEVHRIVSSLAAQGLGILLISSDLPEVLGMSDRVLVVREGRLVAEFDRADATQEAVGLAATGVTAASTYTPPQARGPADQPEVQHVDHPSRWALLSRRRETGLLAGLLLISVLVSLVNPRFLGGSNLRSLGIDAALLGIVALGQLLVMLTRNIDLSVASTIGLTAYISAAMVKDHPGIWLIVPVLVACCAGLLGGLLNGAVVAYGRVPSIVATLATLAIYRGVDAVLSDGKQVAAGDVPDSWLRLTGRFVAGVPILVAAGVALAVVTAAILRRLPAGREIYQVGSSPEAAVLLGVPIRRRVVAAFTVSGLLAGLTGALWASHYATVDGQAAYGLELTVIASVVVGGVALRGGSGTVLGVALGTITLLVIQNALVLARVNPLYLQAFFGVVILAAVILDATLAARTRRQAKARANAFPGAGVAA